MSAPFSENPYQTPEAPLDPPPYDASPFRSPQYCTEAIAALTCSLVGVVFVCIFAYCTILIEPAALILSIVALKRIRGDPNLEGRGLAIAAMVISIVILALAALLLLIVFGILFWRR